MFKRLFITVLIVLFSLTVSYAGTMTQVATGSSAIATTVAPGFAWELESITVHNSKDGGATSLTATTDAGTGAAYDALLYTVAMSGVISLVKTWDPALKFKSTDEVDIAYANGSGATYGLTIKFRPLED